MIFGAAPAVEKGEKLSQSETLRIETVNGARRRGLQKKKETHTRRPLARGIGPALLLRSFVRRLAFDSSKPFQQGANGKRRRKSTVLELPSHVHHSRHARTALGGEVEKNMSFLFGAGRGPNARNCGHSSRAGAVSMGPSGLDRSCSTIRSSVRSHRIVGSQPDLPRRHHCRPAALPFGLPARPPRPVWPHALARGGRSAHLAGLRSTRSQLPSQPDPSGRHPEQSQRAAPTRS